jgi:CMP-2-keto-3-deoxyoctulosonic acid synthetase
VVNVQGDGPRIDPDHIDYLARLLIDHPDADGHAGGSFITREQIADPTWSR